MDTALPEERTSERMLGWRGQLGEMRDLAQVYCGCNQSESVIIHRAGLLAERQQGFKFAEAKAATNLSAVLCRFLLPAFALWEWEASIFRS